MPVKEDVFNLFTNYIKDFQLTTNDDLETDKCYEIITLKIQNAQSPTLVNKKIKGLVNFKPTKGVKIYYTGIPIHSYYASSKSIIEINIISFVSLIFVSCFIYWYFRSYKILLLIMGTILGGFCFGYIVTGLIFPKIHILTFVFSTPLIGICVDYTLHYFCEYKVIKSLTSGLLSTVGALIMLQFTGIELLKQISVFTTSGLFFVFAIVILFFPLLNINFEKNIFNTKFSKKILYIFIAVIILGLPFIKFNDEIKNLYEPSKKMIEAEALYRQIVPIANTKTSFILIEGTGIENILQKEEEISAELNKNSIEYFSLSKFLPSQKRQIENNKLQKKLYEKELKKLKPVIRDINSPEFSNNTIPSKTLMNKMPQLKDFFLAKNKTFMIVFSAKPVSNIKTVNIANEFSKKIKQIRISCLKIVLPVLLLVYFVLGFLFSFGNAHKIILPTIISCLFACSVIHELNVFHILSVFLIIGFGLDYSIFRFNGSKYSKDAVFISCITTVFSFFMLSLTGFKVVSSIGLTLSLGLLSSYILSVLLIDKD